MPGIANYQIPPPAKWEDFEDLCLDLWRRIWRDDHAQKNGRSGQAQHGVDIFGRPDSGDRWAGVQCKGKLQALGAALTKKELLAEVEKAKHFQPQLSEFTIVSTGPRNVVLQQGARDLTDAHLRTGLFTVHVWSWDDVLARLHEYPDVASAHFPHFHPVQPIKVTPSARVAAEPDAEDDEPRADPVALADFSPPHVSARMLPRETLRCSIEQLLETEASVYLHARSGYGKSVLMSQLTLPNLAWFNADEHKAFASFRQRLEALMLARYRIGNLPEGPRDLARAVDRSVAASSGASLVLAIDDADRIDNGVKTFLEEIIGTASHVRVVVTASTLRFKRQHALQAGGRLRILTADDLAFSDDETMAIITAPIKNSDRRPSAGFAQVICDVTHGWPIAVQLVRSRLEREPDEEAIVRSIEDLGKQELSAYLMESFWTSLDTPLKTLLLYTSIFGAFDRSDAQALMPGEPLDVAWDELLSLPFVTQFPQASSLLLYQPLFRTFLLDRLSKERTRDEVRQLQRAAAVHFLDHKHMPPGAYHHAQLSGDPDVLARAAGAMADFAFQAGAYVLLKEALEAVSPTVRWDDPMLAVQQGRLYEHNEDLDNALKWYRRAQVLFDQRGPDYWRNGIVNDIGGILRKTGKTDEAIALYDAVLARLPADEPSIARAGFIANRANVFLQRKAFAEAEAGYLAAKELLELNKSAPGLAKIHHALAQIADTRKQNDQAFHHYLLAYRWARRARNAEILLLIAPVLGELLINRKKLQFAHGVYEEALNAAAQSDSHELLPYMLTNFGFTCALLPEPDPDGVGALMAAREMKRKAGIEVSGTLQNLSTLLMRLGRFARAVPIVREEAQFAMQTHDGALASDAAAKLAELVPGETVDDPGAARRSMARQLMVEGRVRVCLQKRWPLLRDIAAQQEPYQDAHITVGSKSFALRDARTIFFLLPDSVDVSADVPSEPTDDQNFIIELLWPPASASDDRPAGSGNALAAIWWVRTGTTIWVQQFWHDASTASKDSDGLSELKGVLFTFDSESDSWRPAEHPEACDCGKHEVHDDSRQLASAMMAAYSTTTPRHRVVIARRRYPVVSLLPSTPGSLA